MNDMLHAVLTTGSGRRAALPLHPAGGKTGTTQDNRDAWFVGYTAHLTAGVWTGNDDGSPMSGITGSGLPALIWRDVMQEAHRALSPVPLPGVREGAAPVVATGPFTSPRPVPTQHRRAATIVKHAALTRPTTPIDPALFAAPTRPALDTLRLEALLRAK